MSEIVFDHADRQWCEEAAAATVAQLIERGLFHSDQASWAREIVGHTLQERLQAGLHSPQATATALPDYVSGLRDAAASLVMDNQTIRLHAGELTTDEVRCIQAVLEWKQREMLKRAEGGSSLPTQDRT